MNATHCFLHNLWLRHVAEEPSKESQSISFRNPGSFPKAPYTIIAVHRSLSPDVTGSSRPRYILLEILGNFRKQVALISPPKVVGLSLRASYRDSHCGLGYSPKLRTFGSSWKRNPQLPVGAAWSSSWLPQPFRFRVVFRSWPKYMIQPHPFGL